MASRRIEKRSEDTIEKTSWRYRLGIWMFCVPFFMGFTASIIVPILGLSALQTAAIIGAVVLAKREV